MTLALVLDMAVSGHGDRTAVGPRAGGLTYTALGERAGALAAHLAATGARHLAYLDTNGPAFPVALFGAALAGVPFLPLNYRLAPDRLAALLAGRDRTVLLAGADALPAGTRQEVLTPAAALALPAAAAPEVEVDQDDVAVLLPTSGTSAEPKVAVLRHRHLTSYLFSTLEFGAADPDDAALVSVPPYHVAGVANALSNVYTGRRIVYLEQFDAEGWVDTVRREAVTHAMVVPTMLARVLDVLGDRTLPALRSLAYGGARMPASVLEDALRRLPHVDFVNAYGLTETSSTIAVLGPEQHREAVASDDPVVRGRLRSVGQLVPGVEAQVRDADDEVLPPGRAGRLFVRGGQVSGEYAGGTPAAAARDGWLDTRDRAWLDADGYLFLDGRADDTIIRGGENIAPAEIEDALSYHPAVSAVAVIGVPDDEWGQRLAAVIVPRPGARPTADEVRAWVRDRLRGSRTPDDVHFRDELPQTPTGKVLRRVLVEELTAAG